MTDKAETPTPTSEKEKKIRFHLMTAREWILSMRDKNKMMTSITADTGLNILNAIDDVLSNPSPSPSPSNEGLAVQAILIAASVVANELAMYRKLKDDPDHLLGAVDGLLEAIEKTPQPTTPSPGEAVIKANETTIYLDALITEFEESRERWTHAEPWDVNASAIAMARAGRKLCEALRSRTKVFQLTGTDVTGEKAE